MKRLILFVLVCAALGGLAVAARSPSARQRPVTEVASNAGAHASSTPVPSEEPTPAPTVSPNRDAPDPTEVPVEPTDPSVYPTVDTKIVNTREFLIGRARGQAFGMGEENPKLVDIQRLTIDGVAKAEAEMLPGKYRKKSILETMSSYLGDPQAPLYLVRMEGSIRPTRFPPGYKPVRREGIMTVVIDAETGDVLNSGYTLASTSK